MRAIWAGLLLMVVAGAAGAEEPVEWQTHTNEKGKLSVQFPGKPNELVAKGTTQAVLQAEGGKAVYIAAFTDFPNLVPLEGEQPKKVLEGAVESAVKSLKSKLIDAKDMTIGNKYPAKEYRVEAPNLGVYRSRTIVTPQRMYQVVVLGPKEWVEGKDAKKFMDSFRITE